MTYNMLYLYLGVGTREFTDRPALARGQASFEKVYLLNALEPSLDAYEIYPACMRCA